MIHSNLNMIFCTHVKRSPTKTIYIKYYLKKKIYIYIYNNNNKNTLQTCKCIDVLACQVIVTLGVMGL